MSVTFTKLFSSITESTVWCEPHATRIVWITMLAMADRRGRVWASIPGLANRARVTLQECEEAIRTFLAPDPYSRTPDHDGRRIEPIDGGWSLLNYAKYREVRDSESRREQNRQAKRAQREREMSAQLMTVSQSQPQSAQAEAEAESVKAKDTTCPSSPASPETCPHQEIIAIYHEVLPMLPKVREWTPARQALLRSRWRESDKRQSLDWWRRYFAFVRDRCPFLVGKSEQPGRAPFLADLEWLIRPTNMPKVIEGRYQDRTNAA